MKKIVKSIIPSFVLRKYKNYRHKERLKLYAGDEVFCPICKSYFKAFASSFAGAEERKNAKCVKCGSKERHRLLFMFFTEKTTLFNSQTKIKLLHFAPEKFFYDVFSKKQNIEYTPCDLFPDVYDFKDNVKVVEVDVTKIPFEENSFDVILCNHVLEHVPDDKQAMSELYRVMKKEGWGIFQVPIDYKRADTYEDFSITSPKEREKAFGQFDHVRMYGKDYQDRLKSVNFEVIVDDYVKKFSAAELKKFGLNSTHLIYYCKK